MNESVGDFYCKGKGQIHPPEIDQSAFLLKVGQLPTCVYYISDLVNFVIASLFAVWSGVSHNLAGAR